MVTASSEDDWVWVLVASEDPVPLVAAVAGVAVVVGVVAAVAELWPEKARAATAENTPVRARPPATANRVSRETRRRPASRLARGSRSMGSSLDCPRRSSLGNTCESGVNLVEAAAVEFTGGSKNETSLLHARRGLLTPAAPEGKGDT